MFNTSKMTNFTFIKIKYGLPNIIALEKITIATKFGHIKTYNISCLLQWILVYI